MDLEDEQPERQHPEQRAMLQEAERRDQFAVAAMAALIRNFSGRGSEPETYRTIAEAAFRMADAMMKVRGR